MHVSYSIPGKRKPCMQVKFPWSWEELVNPTTHARGFSTSRRKCAFLDGSWVGCLGDLYNFWVEQLIATQICANYGLRNLVGEFCTNPTGSVDR